MGGEFEPAWPYMPPRYRIVIVIDYFECKVGHDPATNQTFSAHQKTIPGQRRNARSGRYPDPRGLFVGPGLGQSDDRI